MTERQGVEIDYCPQCRGVWLDRGELDKIIERSESLQARTDHRVHEHTRWEDAPKYKKKRKSFLEEMFDIFD